MGHPQKQTLTNDFSIYLNVTLAARVPGSAELAEEPRSVSGWWEVLPGPRELQGPPVRPSSSGPSGSFPSGGCPCPAQPARQRPCPFGRGPQESSGRQTSRIHPKSPRPSFLFPLPPGEGQPSSRWPGIRVLIYSNLCKCIPSPPSFIHLAGQAVVTVRRGVPRLHPKHQPPPLLLFC